MTEPNFSRPMYNSLISGNAILPVHHRSAVFRRGSHCLMPAAYKVADGGGGDIDSFSVTID
jgi:hypothetical protein